MNLLNMSPTGEMGNGTAGADTSSLPQLALLDVFFPGFSVFTTSIQKYLGINLNVYIPLVAILGGLVATWRKPSFPSLVFSPSRAITF